MNESKCLLKSVGLSNVKGKSCLIKDNIKESIIINSNLNILCYNVDGLLNKKSDWQFINYIESFEVFFLLETFVEANRIGHFDNLFVDFHLKWIPAVRDSRFGRASGGCLFGIKRVNRVSRYVEFLNDGEYVLVKIQFPGDILYIIPI